MTLLRSLLLLLGLLAWCTPVLAQRSATVNAEIEYLIQRVEKSGATFLRGGTKHSSQEAAAHLRKKLNSAGDRVKSTEDFVDGVASKSYLTGKPYYLVQDGRQVPAGAWLRKALAEKRAGGR